MSGGVDSSVAAYRLKQQGDEVVGITMQLMEPDHDLVYTEVNGGCCSLSTIEDAKRVCDTLSIPHYTLNFRRDFKREVIDRFLASYEKGLTPNPCIDCNRYLKFDLLLGKAQALGADLLATGHYARIGTDQHTGKPALLKGKDQSKDQSYFLYPLTPGMLRSMIFPLGDMEKSAVRTIAREIGLKIADKKDSQEICFIPDDDTRGFLKRSLPGLTSGPVLDQSGKEVGRHEGAALYTIGQRKGLGVAAGTPMYVSGRDVAQNTLTISEKEALFATELTADDVHLLVPAEDLEGRELEIKVRHQVEGLRGSAEFDAATGILKVSLSTPAFAIAPGQAVVLYDGDRVLAGGTIR